MQDGGAADGHDAAPEGKDPAGPGRGGAAPEGKDAGEARDDDGGDDAGERTVTRGRCDELGTRAKKDGFDARTACCGPHSRSLLAFALGRAGEPHDAEAVKLALGMDVNVNATNVAGHTYLFVQCMEGRSRNVELLSWPIPVSTRILLNLCKDRRHCTPQQAGVTYTASNCSSPTGG